VLKAQSIKTGKYVAIKCMKNHFTSLEQVNNLREIQALRRLSPHPHIVKLLEILYDEPTGRLALVFELLEMNLYEWIRGRRHYLPEVKVQGYIFQLLKSIDHMHRNGIFHRDIKPENVLLIDDSLKLADFGSCRGIYSKQPYTEYISTRWYRAPECLLTDGYYNYKMDIWGVGCVFFEVLALFPLFPGTNELDQINKIHNIQGTPHPDMLKAFQEKASHMDFNFPEITGTGIDQLIPHVSSQAREVIGLMLAYDSEQRISAREALKHPYFDEQRQQEKPMRLMNVSPGNLRDFKSSLNGPDDAGGEEPKPVKKKPIVSPEPTVLPQIKGVTLKKPSIISDKQISMKAKTDKNASTFTHGVKKPGLKLMVSPYQKKTYYKSYY
jgi:renal tumor antigen